MYDLWLEFEHGKSNEARYARVIDALVPLINHLTVSNNNYNPNNLSTQKVIENKRFIEKESTELWKLVQKLIKLSSKKGLYS